MAYSKCPACGRAVARVRVAPLVPDPFLLPFGDFCPPARLSLFCPHAGCGVDLLGFWGPGGPRNGLARP